MEKWTYALLLLGSLSVPLIRSFEPRIYFKGKWPALFAGIFIMMLIFIPWDIWFTEIKVWHFNPEYVSGLYIAGLPVEEWLFFIIIPYACMFIYEVLKYFLPRFHWPAVSRAAALGLGFGSLIVALIFSGNLYTVIVASLTGILLIMQVFTNSWKTWLSHFFLAYIVSIIPFLIVNGVLTAFPVVVYDNTQNLALRITTIPIEDFAYLMSMMLIVTMVYERLNRAMTKT